MRVVHINYDGAGWGGASLAMLRIHREMKSQGIDSLIVCRVMPQEPEAMILPVRFCRKFVLFAARVVMKLLYGHVYRVNVLNTGMAEFVNALHPNKVVLHWLHIDTIGLGEIARISAPIEWWVHDLWPMSGVEPYPKTDWFKNGEPNENWISRRCWRMKCNLVNRIRDRLTVIGPSEWACAEARASVVFRGVQVWHIPYPPDADFVREVARQPRAGRPDGKYRILFGAVGGTKNPIKGFDRLLDAVKLLPEEIKKKVQIDIFGEMQLSEVREGIKLSYLGVVKTVDKLVSIFKSADVFAFPSYRETWGQVKSEALLAGCPVVAFNVSACAEGIKHGVNGWIAETTTEFARGLEFFLTHEKK